MPAADRSSAGAAKKVDRASSRRCARPEIRRHGHVARRSPRPCPSPIMSTSFASTSSTAMIRRPVRSSTSSPHGHASSDMPRSSPASRALRRPGARAGPARPRRHTPWSSPGARAVGLAAAAAVVVGAPPVAARRCSTTTRPSCWAPLRLHTPPVVGATPVVRGAPARLGDRAGVARRPSSPAPARTLERGRGSPGSGGRTCRLMNIVLQSGEKHTPENSLSLLALRAKSNTSPAWLSTGT